MMEFSPTLKCSGYRIRMFLEMIGMAVLVALDYTSGFACLPEKDAGVLLSLVRQMGRKSRWLSALQE